jgi:anti-anti-sigma factor
MCFFAYQQMNSLPPCDFSIAPAIALRRASRNDDGERFPDGGSMTTANSSQIAPPIALPELTELVRGNEQQFLERLEPLVRRQHVTLDLENTERIDAAGLAALITLYCDACKAGYRFTIVNPSPRVREILAIVGLDALLVSQNMEEAPCFEAQLQATAA